MKIWLSPIFLGGAAMENTINRNCCAYCRYSSFGQSPLSIVQQKNAIKAYAKEHNLTIVKWFQDEAKTGTNTKRDGYKAMIEYIKKNSKKIGFVLADQIDRFHRHIMNYYVFKNMLLNMGIHIRSAKNEVEDSVNGHMIEGLAIMTAQYIAELTGVRSKQRLIENAEKAEHCGGTPPLGYTLKDNKLVIEEKEAIAVREIFRLYLDNFGYDSIAKELNRRGFCTKKGVAFGTNSIRDLLSNEKYIGTFVYNKSTAKKKYGKKAGTRNSHEIKDESEIVRIENNHEAIISKEQFYQVQEKLAAKSKKNNTTKDRSYILRGLIKCSECGRNLTGNSYSSGKIKQKKYSYYICPSKEVGKCSGIKINRWNMDIAVIKLIHGSVFANKDVSVITDEVNSSIKEDKCLKEQLESFNENISKQKNKLSNLTQALSEADTEVSRKRILKQIEVVDSLLNQLEEAKDKIENKLQTSYSRAEIKLALDMLPQYVKENCNIVTRRWITDHITSMVASKENISISFK